MMRSMDYLGPVLRGLRKACGMRQEDLSAASDLHEVVICRIERGASKCGPDSLYKLAKGFGLRPSTLVFMAEEYHRTEGMALSDLNQLGARIETIEGQSSWQAFLARLATHKSMSAAEVIEPDIAEVNAVTPA